MTPDVLQVAPKAHKVLYENDKIRILEGRFRKGQKLATHSHPQNFVYAVTPMKLTSTSPDGKTRIVKMKKGECSFNEAMSHAVESLVGGVFLQIELK